MFSKNRLSAGGPRHDMLEFKNCHGQVFGRAAIRATVRKTVADLPLEINRNVSAHDPLAVAFWCNVYLARALTVVS